MRLNSTLLKATFFIAMGGATFTYAQVDPEVQDSVAIDSADYEQDILLSETVIIGKGIIDLEENRKTPVAVSTIRREEIQDKAVGNVEFPEILKNTPSVYVAGQSGGFGDSKMFLRGFDQSNTAFLLNGQPINGMEDGNMYWSNWSSMTDVANAIQVQRGLGASKLAISSVGGTVNIVTKATERNQGGMARFVMGNDSYFKGTVAYDTGLKGKWGFSMLLDYWQGHRKYARGTAGQGQSYFFSVGYKPNDHHNFNLMIFGAPQWHDQNYSKGMDEYAMYGDKYNDNYGFYNGEGTTWRKNYYHKPVMNLNWDWNINSQASLSTVLYASLGRGGGTGNFGSSSQSTNVLTDSGYANFDLVAANNMANSMSIGGIDNVGSYGSTGAIRASVNNHFWYGAVSNFNYDLNDYWSFNLGADLRFYKGDHFRQFSDLLGLNGWNETNINRSEDYVVTETFDANPWASLFNFADEDQRIGYDNSEKINYQGGFGQIEFTKGGFSAFVQGAVSNQSYQKFDRWNYQGEAESDKVNKLGYNIKGGLGYNFVDAHTVFANAGFYSRQPFLDNIFVANTVDLYIPEVDNEEITGFEVGYRYDTRKLKVNVNLYHTEWANRFVSISGEDISTLLTDITQIHKGIELDFFAKLSRKWSLRGYTSLGDWKYDGTTPTRTRDDETFETIDGEDLDLTGTYVGDAAQFTFGLGTQFEVVRGLSFDFDMNYFARLYGTVDVDDVIESAQAGEVYQAEELAPYALVDGGMTYEFRLGAQKIRFRANVKNLFNTRHVAQFDGYGYVLGLGRTYNAGLQINF